MSSATIKVFLIHGDPKRLRWAEISNWSGKAIAAPRTEFDDLINREESRSSGVYLLTGFDTESGKTALYIGEAESIKDRIKKHLENDYWNQIVFFVSKDDNLTKAHIKYLEGRLIDLAQNRVQVKLFNSQSSGSRLPESDREDMEIFLEKILQLLPLMGIDVLSTSESNIQTGISSELFYCDIKGLQAKGKLTPNGFIILSGSQAVLAERESAKKLTWIINTRKRLIEDKIILQQGDHLIFTKDAEFSSPSTAAAVVHGGSANGLIAWKNKKGVTIKDLESA